MARAYDALTEHLRGVTSATTQLSFAEIETILGAKLPASAQRHPAWWSNSAGNWYRRIWADAGFRAHARLLVERVEFYRGEFPKLSRHRSHWECQEHLDALEAGFCGYLDTFQARRIFSGPSVYFYEQLVKLVRSTPSLLDLRSSDRLTELAYAALTSWGMHRMGETVAAKLTDFPKFSTA